MMLNHWNSLFDVTRTFNEIEKQDTQLCRHDHDVFHKPAVDIRETDDAFILKCDMPGVSQDKLDVTVDGNRLMIAGKVGDEPEGRAVYRETNTGNYQREFNLGDGIDRESITAEMQSGQLTISIGKSEAVKPRKIEVVTAG